MGCYVMLRRMPARKIEGSINLAAGPRGETQRARRADNRLIRSLQGRIKIRGVKQRDHPRSERRESIRYRRSGMVRPSKSTT